MRCLHKRRCNMRKYIYKGQEYTSVLDLMGPTGISRRALKQLIENNYER